MSEDEALLLEEDEALPGPRVVAAVDCSAGSRAALLFALEDAARRRVPVEVINAYRPPDYWMDFYAVGSTAPDQVRRETLQRTRAFVEEVAAAGPMPTPQVRVRALMGMPADVLLREAHGAELLVVGSRGHGGFATMLLGSTSMQCAQHATCPVTVVHSPEAQHHRLRLHRERHADRREAGRS